MVLINKRSYWIVLLCCVFGLLPNVLRAQEVFQGKIYSQSDSLPIVSEIFALKNHTIIDSFNSDTKGHFEIKTDFSFDAFLFRSEGYRDTTILKRLLDEKSFNLYLQRSSGLLQDVTIVSRNNADPKIKSDRIVYNLKNNISAVGRNVLNLLGEIPGIQVNSNQINLVGKGSVKVSIDGRIVLLSDKELFNYLQTIPSNNIDKLEIVQNPSADMDALGSNGIINIVTKRQKNDGYQLNIQSAYKQFQQYPGMDFAESFTYRHEKWDLFFNSNFSRSHSRFGFGNDVSMPQYDWRQTDTANYRNGNISANFGADYKVNQRSSIGATILLGRYFENGFDKVRNTYTDHAGQLDSIHRSYAIYYPIAYTQSYDLHYEWTPDESGKKLFLDATYFDYDRKDKSDYEGYMLWSDDNLHKKDIRYQSNTAKQKIKIYTFRSDYSLPTSFADFKFGTKLNFINTYVNALYYDKTNAGTIFNKDVSSEYKYLENAEAFYGEGSKKWDAVSLSIGLRGEFTQTKGTSLLTETKQTNNYFQLYPSINLEYKENNENVYSFTFGRRINRPTFWNLNPYKSMLTTYSYYEGNPYLQPEYTTNISVQYNYKNNWVSNLYVSILDNGFGDITIADTLTDFVMRTPKNFVSSNKYGFSEIFTNSDIPWLATNNSISVYYTNSKSKLDYVSNRKGWGAYFSTNNTVYFDKKKNISGLLNFWYQMPETNLVNRSSHYYSLDLGMNWSIFPNKFSLTGNVHDLFGQSGPAYTATVNGINETYRTLQLNRYFSVTATFNLGNSSLSKKEKNEDSDDSKNRL